MKIICIDANYGGGGCPTFFMKPETALLRNNSPLYVPDFTKDLRCGVSVVVRICRLGRSIAEKFAHRYYDSATIGINFAATDLLEECRNAGTPQDCARAFDYSSAVGTIFVPKETINNISCALFRNGIEIQRNSTTNLTWSIDKIIAHISQFVMLKTGDLIFAGTSEYSRITAGDTLTAATNNEIIVRTAIK